MAGELTEVASANLAIRGVLMDGVVDELESLRIDRERAVGACFSSSGSVKPIPRGRFGPFTTSTGETGSYVGANLADFNIADRSLLTRAWLIKGRSNWGELLM